MANALNKAVELLMAGRLEEARKTCRKALQARADLVEGHMLLSEIQRLEGDAARADQSLDRALRLRPGWTAADVEVALGDLYSDFQRVADAERHYRSALQIEPRASNARYNLAGLLRLQGRTDESMAELALVLEHDRGARDARQHLALLLQDARRFDEVDALCREGMLLHPREPFFPQRLGVALWWRARYEEALAAYRLAADLAGEPASDFYRETRFYEATGLLTLGRYAEGWQAYFFRPQRRLLQERYPGLVSQPAAVQGTGKWIRIHREQGLGDEVFFLRFAPALRERGHRLSLICEDKLTGVLAAIPDLFDEVNAPQPHAADVVALSGDLPLLAQQDFAAPLALRPEPKLVEALRERLGAFGRPPYIGVTWRAGLLPDGRAPLESRWSKEIPPESLAETLRALDARVVVLQRRPDPAEVARFRQALGREVLDLSAVNDDLRHALAALQLLEEYVGVSNTNMHLAAGLAGKSIRVLVLTPPEWRWGLEGARSPWFPSFSLYRQRLGRDWTAALRALGADLARLYGASQQ